MRHVKRLAMFCLAVLFVTGCDWLWFEAGPVSPRLGFFSHVNPDGVTVEFPTRPNIPGYPDSNWSTRMYKKAQVLQPNQFTVNDPITDDPILGTANWRFYTNDDKSHLWVYKRNVPETYRQLVFDIFGQDGIRDSSGGENMFISTLSTDQHRLPTLDARVTYSLEGKVRWNRRNAEPQHHDHVRWVTFSGFPVDFIDPSTHQVAGGMFLQIAHDNPGRNRNFFAAATYNNIWNQAGLISGTLPGDPLFQEGATAPLSAYSFVVNDYLCKGLRELMDSPTANWIQTTPGTMNLANWRIGAFYIGVETSNQNGAGGTPHGDASVAIQVSGMKLEKDPETPWTSAECPTTFVDHWPGGLWGKQNRTLSGWVCDPDGYSQPVGIEFWTNGWDIDEEAFSQLVPGFRCEGTGGAKMCLMGSTSASIERPDLIPNGNPCNGTTAHGFSFVVPLAFDSLSFGRLIHARARNFPSWATPAYVDLGPSAVLYP